VADTHRKLTTILSADVEGYSRLMGADEEGTFDTLKTYREALARHIAAYDGRVVNTWGDALIAEFPSVVSAVRAAIDAQNEIAERNAAKPPEARMHFRIGVNLGDVIADGDDIYGDGVNIAARLQSEAPAGGILISRTVHDQVRNKLSVGFEFLGNLEVKNIEEAVPAFSVRVGNPDMPSLAGLPRPQSRQPAQVSRKPSGPVEILTGNRTLLALAVVPLALIPVNLLAWQGYFWAAWPLLAVATLAGMAWTRRTKLLDRWIATALVIGAMLVVINLLSWHGYFWAIWPVLALAVAAALRFVAVGRRGP
jgi:class 3 adenylate cyclase